MKTLLKSDGFQIFLASCICVLLGLCIGFAVLFIIHPDEAVSSMLTIMEGFLFFPNEMVKWKYFGNILVKTAPLLMCSLSVIFSYKAGLFNIGASGQYTAGVIAALITSLYFSLPWYFALAAAVLFSAVIGALTGALKTYFNVNEVISGIMLNWTMLYFANTILALVKDPATPYTLSLSLINPSALLPSLGLDLLFSGNRYVSLAVPASFLFAFAVLFIMQKTVFGYEIKATGYNKFAARYAGMQEHKNIVLTMCISGAFAGLGAAFLYLTDFELWDCSLNNVPIMGFNGLAAAFLGGLSPVGALASSYFIQHITEGCSYLDRNLYCSQVGELIISIIIYLCSFAGFLKIALRKYIDKINAGVN